MIVKPTLRTKFGQPGSKISAPAVSHSAASDLPMCATSDKTSSGIFTSRREEFLSFEIFVIRFHLLHLFSV